MEHSISVWIVWHAIAMILATAVSMMLGTLFPAMVVSMVSIAMLILVGYGEWKLLRPLGGWANLVTLLRFFVLIVAMLIQSQVGSLVFIVLIILVLIADGLDGYLARRLKQATSFGEILDTEVDAFLALSLSLCIWYDHHGAFWLIAAGILRYIYMLLYRSRSWHQVAKPLIPETKIFAVIYFVSLLTPWVLQWSIARWIAGGGCVLVAISFGWEYYLMRQATRKEKDNGYFPLSP